MARALQLGVHPRDAEEGFYWDMDGEKQNRCPRTYIRDHADTWGEYILAYKAFEAGFLPSDGGTDAQPALFIPAMMTISTAISKEQELQRHARARRDKEMEAFKSQQAQNVAKSPKRFVNLPDARRT